MIQALYSLVGCILLSTWIWRKWASSQELAAFATQQGCQPIKNIVDGNLPLGIDLVRELWTANANQRIMTCLQSYIVRLGPSLELRMLGNKGLVTIDPENIKATLTKSKFSKGELDFVYGNRRDALLPLFGEGLFTQDGSAWKHSREIVRKQFARIQYNNLEVFTEHVELLIGRLRDSKEPVVNLHPLFCNFTLDTTTSLLFGESADSLREGAQDELGESLGEASWWSCIRVQLAYLWWLCSPPKLFRLCGKVREYADHWVEKALDQNQEVDGDNDRYIFIQSLYDELQDRKLVRDQLVNVLLAGRDTTAGLLAWTFRALVRHNRVLSKLRKEVQDVLGDDAHVTKAKLQNMPYLKCIMTETLRLWPSVPVNFREAGNTTIWPRGGGPDGLSPVLVPKNKGIGYAPYHMHRRKDLYGDDALEFRPERWEDGTLQERIGWGYLPFNGGPRICLGQEFALLEASYVVARIVQSFPKLALPVDEEVVPPGDEKQNLTLTMAPADGCRVRLY